MEGTCTLTEEENSHGPQSLSCSKVEEIPWEKMELSDRMRLFLHPWWLTENQAGKPDLAVPPFLIKTTEPLPEPGDSTVVAEGGWKEESAQVSWDYRSGAEQHLSNASH